ncbi:putative uncharacterized protein DDB_G0271606 [Gigantopelta aegis]|uniref:putative uncharacterized protein DDB_G0271606 n=1 Tax=Gigantopelta aegis TaxID=1735272 RepID=UPI001B88BAA1|nr:putative uncharacterized protein DDB_G0271606 [Gigantopelta aegis]
MRHKGKYYTPLDVATLKGHKEVELHLIYNGGRTGCFITNDAAIIIQRNFKLRKKFLRPNSPKVRVRLTTPTPVNDSEQEQDKNGDNNNDSGKIEDKRESKDSASSHICHNSVHVVINLPDQKQDLDEESDNKNNSKRDNKNYSKIDNKNYDKTDNKIDNDTAFKNFDETDHKSKNGYAYVPSRLVRNDTNKGCGCMCVPSKPAGSSTDKPGKHPNKTSMGTQPTKQRAEVKFENSPRHQTTDHRMTINKENNSEKQHQQKQQQHQHQQQHHYKQQQHQLQQQQKQQQYHQQQQAYSKPVSMQNGYIKGDVNRNAVPEGKSHQTELSLHIKKPLLRMGKSRRDIASDVQASVRRFEVERQAVRDYHQLKRAQMYTGPLYDIELVNKMVDKYHTEDLHSNAYQSSGHSEKNFSETSESMNDHQKNPDEISQDMTSLSDHQEEKDMKKTKSDKKLEMIVSRTEDLFNNLNKRVSGTLERAKTTNSRLRESLSSDKANRMIAQDKKEKIQEQRNQKYNEWRKQKAEELHQRLMKAYKPSYSRQQFSVSRGSSRSKRSDSPSRTSGSTSRPPTTQSYHSMPVAMPRYSSTTYSQRQRACSANPESYTTIMTRYGLRTIRKDSEPKVSWSCNSRDARTKQGLVFLPPDAYEEKVKQDKKKREEMIQEQELGQSTV